MMDGAPRQVGDIDLAGFVLAERADAQRGVDEPRGRPRAAVQTRAPDDAGAEVAVEVGARQRGELAAAVAVAAGDRALSGRVVVFEDRVARPARRALHGAVEDRRAFLGLPAVIAAGDAGRLKIHLFARALADVGDEQVAALAVERDAPRIAQAERPDLAARAWRVDERIARRRRARRPVGLVDADALSRQRAEVVAVAVGTAAPAAAADAGKEPPAQPDREPPAIVVGEARVRLRLEDELGLRIRHVGIGRDVVAGDGDFAG